MPVQQRQSPFEPYEAPNSGGARGSDSGGSNLGLQNAPKSRGGPPPTIGGLVGQALAGQTSSPAAPAQGGVASGPVSGSPFGKPRSSSPVHQMEVDSRTTEERVDSTLDSQIPGTKSRGRDPPRVRGSIPQPRNSMDGILQGLNMNAEGRQRLQETCRRCEARLQTAT
eukprot:6641612-Karenia_brevis.AAC.1